MIYGATALTGGATGALDAIDGAVLADNDGCISFENEVFYVHRLEASSGAAESSPDVISPDSNAGTKRWLIQTSYTVRGRVNKDETDSPYTVTVADLNGFTIFTNTGATGETIFQRPAGADGYKFRGVVTAAQYMQFLCDGTETIRYLVTQTAAGGYVRSATIGNVIEADWSGTEWVITGIGGPW